VRRGALGALALALVCACAAPETRPAETAGATAATSTAAATSAPETGRAETAAATAATTAAATAAAKGDERMRALVTDLLGDDLKRHEAARKAIVKAGAAAVDALIEGLDSPLPSARETIVLVAVEAGEPAATRVLRAAVERGHLGSVLQLLERKHTDDLVWALGQPALARAVDWMVGDPELRGSLGGIVAEYAKAWPAVKDAVGAARAGATGQLAAFLDEIARRAGGAAAAWPVGSKGPEGR
jgi:hypothetical protein